MSYCPNPVCPSPDNERHGQQCQTCGTPLVLGDRYRLLKPLRQGGFGATFLAVDETTPARDRCVVKQFLPQLQGRDQAAAAAALFQDEAKRLADLGTHPQIPRFLDQIEQDSYHYIVQEFIDGYDLDQILADQGPLRESQIWFLLKSLLPVLDFIHSARIIHRDIKPANIIRRADRQLILVDFGASKYVTGTALARSGTVIGSAGYAAPEQAFGKAVFASDLYSLGVTCIHLLTGQHPFDLYSVSGDGWVWQQYLPQPVSDRLTAVLNRLLERSLVRRYATASDVLEEIRQSRPHREPQPDPAPNPWRCVRIFSGHRGSITAIAVSPDGTLLASGSRDQSIKIWGRHTGKLIHTIAKGSRWGRDGHAAPVRGLVFTQDAQTLISGGEDGTVWLWDVPRQMPIGMLPAHSWGVTAIALSPDDRLLAVGSADGAIQLWDLARRERLQSLRPQSVPVTALAMSDDGAWLVNGGDRPVRIWDLTALRRTGEVLLWNTILTDAPTVALALSRDRQWLLTGGDRSIQVWDTLESVCRQTIRAHQRPISAIALSPEGRLLASGGEDSKIQIGRWDGSRFRHHGSLKAAWVITALAFCPDGSGLISAGADETLQLWDYEPLGGELAI
jgi:WD40 repeat protein